MKKTARLIVTYHCKRKCPGCCNQQEQTVSRVSDIKELLKYQEVIITGGEPMLLASEVIYFIEELREVGFQGKIFMYTSWWNGKEISKSVLKLLNGITFTLHNEANDKDIMELKSLSNSGYLQDKNFNSRLFIDGRLFEKYDFSNINLNRWDVIRKLQWKDKCEPAEHEDLLSYLL